MKNNKRTKNYENNNTKLKSAKAKTIIPIKCY